MGWSMLIWVGLGYWWEIYDHIDAAHPRLILRDAFRQCLLGAASVIPVRISAAAGPQPFVRALFAVSAWVLRACFRLKRGGLRRLGSAHYVMMWGWERRRRGLDGRSKTPGPMACGLLDFRRTGHSGTANGVTVHLSGALAIRSSRVAEPACDR